MEQSPWLAHSLTQRVLLGLLQGQELPHPPRRPGRMRPLPGVSGNRQLGKREWRRTLSKLLHTQGCGSITFPWRLVPGAAVTALSRGAGGSGGGLGRGARAGVGSSWLSPGL